MTTDGARPPVTGLAAELLSRKRLLDVLRPVADTPAPSGASSMTRGAVVESWFDQELAPHGAVMQRDVGRSGCDVIRWGSGGMRMLAHLDEVSYLVDGRVGSDGTWPLAPYCYHLAEEPAPARAVRFDAEGAWTVTGSGRVITRGRSVHFDPDGAVGLEPGDRVCLASPLSTDPATGLVTGSLDNAAGVAAGLMAASVLARARIPFELVLTDEEEGPSGSSSQTISRGAMRYFNGAPDAPLHVVIDIHGVPHDDAAAVEGHRVPWGASFAEFSSHGRGSVAPPQLYAAALATLRDSPVSGRVRQNVGGYVPRSDDVVAMTRSNRVLILGYPGINRHFDRGLPTANAEDLVDLARALVALATEVHCGDLVGDG